jgi:D-threo-aldose 1-dehydrogenase
MHQLTLGDTDLRVSALGFGCGQLMARTARRDSLRLLEAAFGSGITHFDVARMYGYGEAESALGEFAAPRRHQVTITTKLGIDPPQRGAALSLARAAAKRVVAVVPQARRLVRRQAARLVTGGRFDVDAARRSLETSLRELRTDYIDVLLLHGCVPADVSPELLEFLRARVAEGSVRHYGLATAPEATRQIVAERPAEPFVVQFASSVLGPNAECIEAPPGGGVITHSALGAALNRLHTHVSTSPERLARWSRELDVDCADRGELGRLMLASALRANPAGAVLYSSRNEEHIRANAALTYPPTVPAERLRRLGELVRESPIG